MVGRLEDSELIVRKLGATVYRLYAATSYIDRRDQPRTVADLPRHDAVLHRGAAGRSEWELLGPRGRQTVTASGALSGDSHQFVLDAVVSGHGIGLVPEQLVAHSASSASTLVNVLPKFVSMGALQSLVSPSRHLPKRVTLARDFLAEHLLGG